MNREGCAIAWVAERLGAERVTPKERALRLLEEAVELAQAEGVPWHTSCDLLAHVFDRPIGIPEHEAANVAFALYAYCASRGLSVAELFDGELARNQARSAEDLAASVARKDEAGISNGSGPLPGKHVTVVQTGEKTLFVSGIPDEAGI